MNPLARCNDRKAGECGITGTIRELIQRFCRGHYVIGGKKPPLYTE